MIKQKTNEQAPKYYVKSNIDITKIKTIADFHANFGDSQEKILFVHSNFFVDHFKLEEQIKNDLTDAQTLVLLLTRSLESAVSHEWTLKEAALIGQGYSTEDAIKYGNLDDTSFQLIFAGVPEEIVMKNIGGEGYKMIQDILESNAASMAAEVESSNEVDVEVFGINETSLIEVEAVGINETALDD